jgi:hypothetical protein
MSGLGQGLPVITNTATVVVGRARRRMRSFMLD